MYSARNSRPFSNFIALKEESLVGPSCAHHIKILLYLARPLPLPLFMLFLKIIFLKILWRSANDHLMNYGARQWVEMTCYEIILDDNSGSFPLTIVSVIY